VAEEDLIALYKYAHVYCLPSFYEGFGFTPLEAMQTCTPVIASNKASIPEICGKDNALYFDPYNINDIKEKMKIVATDASVRQRLIDRGFERVKEFKWDKMAKEVLEVYNSIVKD
jgi:glycosyltransferase involved in cell wall biosynthesis